MIRLSIGFINVDSNQQKLYKVNRGEKTSYKSIKMSRRDTRIIASSLVATSVETVFHVCQGSVYGYKTTS